MKSSAPSSPKLRLPQSRSLKRCTAQNCIIKICRSAMTDCRIDRTAALDTTATGREACVNASLSSTRRIAHHLLSADIVETDRARQRPRAPAKLSLETGKAQAPTELTERQLHKPEAQLGDLLCACGVRPRAIVTEQGFRWQKRRGCPCCLPDHRTVHAGRDSRRRPAAISLRPL